LRALGDEIVSFWEKWYGWLKKSSRALIFKILKNKRLRAVKNYFAQIFQDFLHERN